jgi:hypothetical protein
MHIKTVIIKNFKSYKDVNDLEEFSNKSNVIGTFFFFFFAKTILPCLLYLNSPILASLFRIST